VKQFQAFAEMLIGADIAAEEKQFGGLVLQMGMQ
jgi:hypothetical protein